MRISRADLERARDDLSRRVEADPWWAPLEQLARTHRWLGEEDEARRRFREAATDEAALDTVRAARVAALLWLAREPELARPWLDRALDDELERGVLATLHYLAGDHGRAAAVARELSEDPDERPYPWAEAVEALAIGRRDRDEDGLSSAVVATFADLVRLQGVPPWEESGAVGLSVTDWLYEAFRTEAEMLGGPLPPPERMLHEAGLGGD